jgi:signal transduction histidine kinase
LWSNPTVKIAASTSKAAGVYNILDEGEKKIELEADPERIQRVIVNFVNNAIKYAPESKDIRDLHGKDR